MTVSHIYYNGKIVDASTNYQVHERNQKKENPDEKIVLGYDLNDPNFMEIVKSVALSTYTIFAYHPSDEECQQLYARMNNTTVAKVEKMTLSHETMKDLEKRMIFAEKNMLYIKRHC
jgi:hypothetical protein